MGAVALIMFACAMALLLLGYPVAFTLGAVAMVFGGALLGMDFFTLLPLRIWGIVTNFTLLAVPLFVFMGVVLERSGLAQELLETMGALCGRISGGLGLAVVVVGALLGATTGVVGATVVTMGVITLPAMLRHRYDVPLATGTIAASGTLGQIIPPSIVLILLGDVMGVSIGELFMAAVIPGVILVSLFAAWIALVAWRAPARAPAVALDDGGSLAARVAKSLLPPITLIVAVLGSIFFGIASPTESAAIGASGALLLAALRRRLGLKTINDAAQRTVRLTSMVFIILVGATAFGLVFRGLGGDHMVKNLFLDLPGGPATFLFISMTAVFVLGFFLDFIEICFIVVPILAPIGAALGIDPLWFAVLLAVNLQTSFLTPPFGFSLFYLKAVAPPEVRIEQIYRGIVPFVGIQLITLALIVLWPGLVRWLPDMMAEWSL